MLQPRAAKILENWQLEDRFWTATLCTLSTERLWPPALLLLLATIRCSEIGSGAISLCLNPELIIQRLLRGSESLSVPFSLFLALLRDRKSTNVEAASWPWKFQRSTDLAQSIPEGFPLLLRNTNREIDGLLRFCVYKKKRSWFPLPSSDAARENVHSARPPWIIQQIQRRNEMITPVDRWNQGCDDISEPRTHIWHSGNCNEKLSARRLTSASFFLPMVCRYYATISRASSHMLIFK